MNTVNDEVQRLFAKYENDARSKYSERVEDVESRGVLSEIENLRGFWAGVGQELDHPLLTGAYRQSLCIEMYEQIRNKLGMKIERANEDDYWWSPPEYRETERLLWEIAAVLNKAATPSRRRISAVVWHIAKELVYLGIIVVLLLSAQSRFETKVIALLVLIYNRIVFDTGSVGLGVNSIQTFLRDEVRSVARSMKLKVPVVDYKISEQFGMAHLLTHVTLISCTVGDLIALVALVWSLF